MKTPVRTRLLSALLSLVMLVSLLPVSVFAAEPASGTWEKVTEAQEDWSGQYLIVAESTFPASPARTRSSPAPLRSSTPSPSLMVM